MRYFHPKSRENVTFSLDFTLITSQSMIKKVNKNKKPGIAFILSHSLN